MSQHNNLQTTTCYEHPLNERARLFMRIEQLMKRFFYAAEGLTLATHTTPTDYLAMQTLVDLYEVTERIDLRSELMREIERMTVHLEMLKTVAGVDIKRLNQVTDKLQHKMDALDNQTQPHVILKSHELFKSIKQRCRIPGGLNSFDVPQFTFWQRQSTHERQSQLMEWIQPFTQYNHAIVMLLDIYRESGASESLDLEGGFHEMSLGTKNNYQLLRIWLEKDCGCYPEISSGRQRFTLRLMLHDDFSNRARQMSQTVNIQIMRCSF